MTIKEMSDIIENEKQSASASSSRQSVRQTYTASKVIEDNILCYADIFKKFYSFRSFMGMGLDDINHVDVAKNIYQTDYADIKSYRALQLSKTDVRVYVPTYGIWVEQISDSKFKNIINNIRDFLKYQITDKIKYLQSEGIYNTGLSEEEKEKEKDTREYKIDVFNKLHKKLGDNPFRSPIISNMIEEIICETELHEEFKTSNFDLEANYVGFKDGVYSFEKGDLLDDKDALPLMITTYIPYTYEEVVNCPQDVYEGAKGFVEQVLPNKDVRDWFMKRVNNALRGIVEKYFLICYNLCGDNGKTKLLELIGASFGDMLYAKCNNKILNRDNSGANAANEELMKIMGKVFVALSEADANKTICMSFVKELIGGDGISGRKMYKGVEEFKAKALMVLICNSMPSIDTKDKGSMKKIKCVPFESTFVSKEELPEDKETMIKKVMKKDENGSDTDEVLKSYQVIYEKDENISTHFKKWRIGFMKYLLEYNNIQVNEPYEVQMETKEYRNNEDYIQQFVDERICKTKEINIDKPLYFHEIWDVYKDWIKEDEERNFSKEKKASLNTKIHSYLDKTAYMKDTTRNGKKYKNCWLGYKINFGNDNNGNENDAIEK